MVSNLIAAFHIFRFCLVGCLEKLSICGYNSMMCVSCILCCEVSVHCRMHVAWCLCSVGTLQNDDACCENACCEVLHGTCASAEVPLAR